ncbi:hypothetical protein HYV64_01170 [Candidatus Shapirobacteria bacterium]|nr:hypothetical protein [Candidatus Shapirobacteria bacterium]
MQLDVPVSVISSFNHHLKIVSPRKVLFGGREYYVTKIGLHHTHRIGRTLYHVFSVAANHTFLKLSLNTDNLFWSLEDISDEV